MVDSRQRRRVVGRLYSRTRLIENLILRLFPDDSVACNINEDGASFPSRREILFRINEPAVSSIARFHF